MSNNIVFVTTKSGETMTLRERDIRHNKLFPTDLELVLDDVTIGYLPRRSHSVMGIKPRNRRSSLPKRRKSASPKGRTRTPRKRASSLTKR